MKSVSLAEGTRHATATIFLVSGRADRTQEGRRLAVPLVGGGERDRALALRGTHPDVIELIPPEGKERVGIERVREAIRSCQFTPVQSRQKVCLIPKAEALTPEAANALLKTLEEPPREMAFVLLVSHTTDLLPTIVSRSRIVRLPPRMQTVDARLRERGYTAEDIRWLSAAADREGEIDRFLDAKLDMVALRKTARQHVPSLEPTDLVSVALDGEPILRWTALSELLRRASRRDVPVFSEGVRILAAQTREKLFVFLQDLLTVCSAGLRTAVTDGETPSADCVACDPERLRSACVEIDRAHRALSAHGPTEAVFLSLFLSIGEASYGA